MTVLPGVVFFRLAWRLSAYAGVVQILARAEQEGAGTPAAPPGGPSLGARPREVNPGTQTLLKADPAFSGLISFG